MCLPWELLEANAKVEKPRLPWEKGDSLSLLTGSYCLCLMNRKVGSGGVR